jgi:hypothetical protein
MKQDIRRLDVTGNWAMVSATELRGEMREAFATLRGEMRESFATPRGEMKAGRWADRIAGLAISAGILATMARGFKWI